MFRRSASNVLILSVLTLFFWRCHDRLPQPSEKTPVFLISVDTLRSDHLPVYGYEKISTPNIDEFRADSVLYSLAYSQCPLTLPSHATVLTGLLPADTGVRDNVGYLLRPEVPTLASVLKSKGYLTGAAVSSYVLRRQTGISRAFDFYDDEVDFGEGAQTIGRIQRQGGETIKVAKEWISSHRGQPLFFFLHLYEPHTPYEPPEPYRSRYSLRYDGEIAHVDELVGNFLEFLKGSDLYDRSLIIFFSDHGEALGEHDEDEHGIFLYREAIQVPLIVKLPKSRFGGSTSAVPVGLFDIAPTVAWQTNTKIPGDSVAGKSLFEFLGRAGREERRFIYSETYYPRFHFGWSDLHSVIDGNVHFVEAPKAELYDVKTDLSERHNVLSERRRDYAAARKAIEPLIREAEAPAPITTEEASKLAALGYLGGVVATQPGQPLPDPKDHMDVFRDIRRAFTMTRNQQFIPALELIDRLLNENRGMRDLWSLKARALTALGRDSEAIAAAREGLKLAPTDSHLALTVANLSLEARDFRQAEDHAALLLKSDPAQAHEILARVWIARRDFDRARREAELALATDGDRVISFMTLGRVEKERKNYEAALGHLDAATAALKRKHGQSVSGLHFLRGDILARLDRSEEAEREFLEEIRLFPSEPVAYKHLILLYVGQGRLSDGTKLIYDLIKASPTPPAYLAVADTLKVVGDENGARYWARRGLKEFPNDTRLRRLATAG